MTNKQNKVKTREQVRAKAYAKRHKNNIKGPAQMIGSVLGGIAGMALGGPLGAGAGASLGSALGNGIGYLTGSGDYKVQTNACLVPGFKNGDSTVITHREYITDIKSGSVPVGANSSSFDITKFELNPGVSSSFPWLAAIAANYEEYDILGMVFAYVATSGESVASTNTALGTVILATAYDPTKPDFVNKQAMENYSFATSSKPSVSQMHAVECAKIRTPVKQLYVRSGSNTGTDLRWTDFGNFYIATVGCPAAATTLGELWVTYKIKLVKPRLPITVGFGGQIASGITTRAGVTNTMTSIGTIKLKESGSLRIEIVDANKFRFKALPNMDYQVTTFHYGTDLGTCNDPTVLGGKIKPNAFRAGIQGAAYANSSFELMHMNVIECTNADTDDYITVTVNITGTPTAGVDIIVTQVDETF